MKKILMVCASSLLLFACNKKDCEPGMTGPDCDIQNGVPESITVNSVELSSFPETKDDGSGWDDDGSPDIYFKLFQNGTEIYTSETVTDVTAGTTVNYTDEMPFTISDVNDQFTIEWFDDDSALGIGFVDEMGSFSIDLWSDNNDDGEIMVSPSGSEFTFTLHIDNNF